MGFKAVLHIYSLMLSIRGSLLVSVTYTVTLGLTGLFYPVRFSKNAPSTVVPRKRQSNTPVCRWHPPSPKKSTLTLLKSTRKDSGRFSRADFLYLLCGWPTAAGFHRGSRFNNHPDHISRTWGPRPPGGDI